MSHIEINQEKKDELQKLAEIKIQKEKNLEEKITATELKGDTTASIRVDSFMSRKNIDVNFGNKEVFWASDGVVRVEYDIEKLDFKFNNSSGGTNSVSAERIVDAYSDIYESAKNVIANIKKNKFEYSEKIDEILNLRDDIQSLNSEIDNEINQNIDEFINSKLESVGIKDNSIEDVEKLLKKAEESGRIDIFSCNSYEVSLALRDQAYKEEDVDVDSSRFRFKQSSLSCEVSENNAKRYYINDQFIKRKDVVENLKNYITDDSKICETLKNEKRARMEVSFKDIKKLSTNVQEHKELQNFLKVLELDGKNKTKSRNKPSI